MAWVTKTWYETYTETESAPEWDAGARSVESFSGDGGFTWTVSQGIGIVVGLNNDDRSTDYQEAQHGFYIESGRARVIESGVFKTSFQSFAIGATFKVERLRGEVSYYINDVWVYTSFVVSEGTVFLDSSLYSHLDAICNAAIFDGFLAEAEIELHPLAAEFEEFDNAGNISLQPLEASGFDPLELLLHPLAAIGGDADLNSATIELHPLSVSGRTLSEESETLSLHPLVAVGSDVDLNRAAISLRPLIASGITTDDVLIPEYNAGYINLQPPIAYGNTDDRPGEEAELELEPLRAVGSEIDGVAFAALDLQPLAVIGAVGAKNYLLASYSRWGMTIEFVESGFASITLPAPVLLSYGFAGSAGAILRLPPPVLSARSGARTTLALPAPVLSATGDVPGFATCEIELPAPVLAATGITGAAASVASELPAPTLLAYGGGWAAMELPAVLLSATGQVTALGRVAIKLPAPILMASGDVTGLGSVAIELPAPILSAGLGNYVAITLPAPLLTAVGTAPTLPADVDAETTYAVNLSTGAVTQLLLGKVERLVLANGRLYAVQDGALWVLSGEDDDGTSIPATVRFAPQSFGTNRVKRMTEVYLTAREYDGVTLELVADELKTWRYQTAPGPSQRYGAHKISVGRGVTFHTAGLTVRNRDGGKLDIGGIEPLVEGLSRKVP